MLGDPSFVSRPCLVWSPSSVIVACPVQIYFLCLDLTFFFGWISVTSAVSLHFHVSQLLSFNYVLKLCKTIGMISDYWLIVILQASTSAQVVSPMEALPIFHLPASYGVPDFRHMPYMPTVRCFTLLPDSIALLV